ncbi:MAG: type II toxin-antitoxin system VapC family toxin [Armatimonadetes bacterium]|nr:type II toxin-antitoxin system VapC family toxin [Armatimonadota bacterium]MDW8027624.1 type II toxin-antitoxin system VapC family toxin [Armatimonadota bacterium]
MNLTKLLFESSAFVKYFQPEAGSPKVIALIDNPNHQALVSWLTFLEFHSALLKRVRMGELILDEFHLIRRTFYAYIRSGQFRIVWWSPNQLLAAISLLLKHGQKQPLRTLDALQLAIALNLKEQGLLDAFVCADETLCQVASEEGLPVINPLQ